MEEGLSLLQEERIINDFSGRYARLNLASNTSVLVHAKISQYRGVAQLGSASVSGAEGRRFKSSRPDIFNLK